MKQWLSKNLWNLQANSYNSLISWITSTKNIYSQKLIPVILSNINPVKKNSLVLELGCGEGYLDNEIAKTGYKIDAIDSSKNLIDIAKKKYSLPHFYHLDAFEIDKMKKKYDLILANLSIHDMPRVRLLTKKIYQILKRNGLFIFTIPHPCFFLPSSQNYHLGKNKYLTIEKYRTTKKFLKKLGEGITVFHYHRTLESYFSIPSNQGFRLIGFKEIFDDNKQSIYFEIPAFIIITFQR